MLNRAKPRSCRLYTSSSEVGGGLGENPQPREWVDTLEDPQLGRRDRGAGGPMEAVAAGNPVARQLESLPLIEEPDARAVAVNVVQ